MLKGSDPAEAPQRYFACALCPPSAPRPASVTCANGCGRHVCVDHAHPLNASTHGPLVCQECWETIFQYGERQLVDPDDRGFQSGSSWLLEQGRLPRSASSQRSSFVLMILFLGFLLVLGFVLLILIFYLRAR